MIVPRKADAVAHVRPSRRYRAQRRPAVKKYLATAIMAAWLITTPAFAFAAASPSNPERAPITCEQFIASINDGGKDYEAPPLTIGKTLAYGDFKDSQLTMFPDVYMGLSCLNGHLDTFEVMPESREMMAAFRSVLTIGIALHALGWIGKRRSTCGKRWSVKCRRRAGPRPSWRARRYGSIAA